MIMAIEAIAEYISRSRDKTRSRYMFAISVSINNILFVAASGSRDVDAADDGGGGKGEKEDAGDDAAVCRIFLLGRYRQRDPLPPEGGAGCW